MRTKKPLVAALTAVYVLAGICTAGAAVADPTTPDPGTDTSLCPYPDVNNPNCTQFPDDHDGVGDSDDHPGGHGR
ncbi:hypothetical protein [Nocardia sp. CDC160]|uniref:hypothetical protein n=1 Tax=Nocardia sp. CDC160 TaxID=3112166 RepID=UPI002DB55BBC|nr:hypothetical protein [Nocardia sp. CDC160]MEC3918356.1 hypothetical protein [Nocardia sp. CDC160]